MDLIKTHRGLPNSCSVCGRKITTDEWFALNTQAAIAGQGGHKKCLQDQNEPELESEPEAPLEPEPEPEDEE